MTDEVFIEAILQKGKEAKDKVSLGFGGISSAQLNWRSLPGSWSMAQCLDHLIESHNAYFPVLKKVTEGSYKMNFWERHSPFSTACGRIMKDRLQEQVKKKMIAPKIIRPSSNKMQPGLIEDYTKSLDIFLEYISNCRNIDIDKIIITSPTISIVTYSLRDAFLFLLQHEHRHINQGIRVKLNEDFPKE